MTSGRLRPSGGHHVLAVATGLLALSGLICIGVAVTRDAKPQQPALSRGESAQPPGSATEVEQLGAPTDACPLQDPLDQRGTPILWSLIHRSST